MDELSVATTINPRFDHVTPIEATQSSVTITHRCHIFAELMAVARSGLVDIVLIADDFELVSLETLQQVKDAEGQGPKIMAISDVVDERQRLTELGIPVASPTLTGVELVIWLQEANRNAASVPEPPLDFSVQDLQILEQLDPDAATKRRSGRRAAPYDPMTDIPEPANRKSQDEALDIVDHHVMQPLSSSEGPGLHAIEASQGVETILPEASESVSRRGQLTAVWGPIGSPGVTTLAVNMAVESALHGRRTLLIDADTYGAAVAVHMGLLEDAAAIAQACRAIEHRGITTEELADYAQSISIQGASLDVITGLTRSERWPQLRAAAWNQLLEIARDGWEHIIVDCGFGLEEDEELSFDIPAPQRNATTLGAVTSADTIVAVGTGDPVGFVRFMKGLEQLAESTSSPVVPVINKVTSMTSGLGPKRQLNTVWDRFGPKMPLQHFLPWAPEVTAAALFEGKTLAERAPKAEVRQAIREVMLSCFPAGVSATPDHSTKGRNHRSQRSWRKAVAQVKGRVGRTP